MNPPDYSLLDREGASARIFFPRPDDSDAPDGARDYDIEVAPGVTLGARLYAADAAWPTILYFHGNGEVVGDHDDIAPLYHERASANLFVVDFRGYGRSGGRPSFATLAGDAHPVAARFHELLDELGFPGARFVMGRSLGSHPALEIAANAAERFAGVIIESGAASLRRVVSYLGASISGDEAQALSAAHEAKIRAIQRPALIIHGEQDELVPLTVAEELYDLLAATEREREIVVIPGAGHNDLLWVGLVPYFTAIASFLRRNSPSANR